MRKTITVPASALAAVRRIIREDTGWRIVRSSPVGRDEYQLTLERAP